MTIDCLGRDNDQFGLECKDESLTVQSDAVDADINRIVERFGITGQLPTNLPYVTVADLTEAPADFREVQDILKRGADSFAALPANVRSRFENDPILFMEFCSNEANLEEMRALGLAVPKKEEPVLTPAPKP